MVAGRKEGGSAVGEDCARDRIRGGRWRMRLWRFGIGWSRCGSFNIEALAWK